MSSAPNWKYTNNTLESVPGWTPAPEQTPFWTEQLFTPEEADAMFYNVIAQYHKKQLSTVYQWDGTGSVLDLNSRYTHYYDPALFVNYAEVESRFNNAVQNAVRGWMGLTEATTQPAHSLQVLGYEERCLFRTHCDNCVYDGTWHQNDIQRDVTSLVYLTDSVQQVTGPAQFSGGELLFDNIQADGYTLTLRPRKGQMVLFPSHPMYTHQVLPVTKGYRVALVNWFQVKNGN